DIASRNCGMVDVPEPSRLTIPWGWSSAASVVPPRRLPAILAVAVGWTTRIPGELIVTEPESRLSVELPFAARTPVFVSGPPDTVTGPPLDSRVPVFVPPLALRESTAPFVA